MKKSYVLAELPYTQIYKYLRTYMSDKEISEYKYVGFQFISNNNYIYATFKDKEGYFHTFNIGKK
ncbi:MAG: hypothetical protein GXX85_05275 [Ignavibacteria bacterium]|nr:hypothetical protein [Ignavibacteria bacterium]